MKPEWRKYLAARAPRYTSYPSALHFDSSVSREDYADRLSAVELYEPLSLYVHVPFCKKLCWYCGCNMRVENDYSRALRYVSALAKEISLVGGRLAGAGRPRSVHFGGGTPNYLLVDEIADILQAIELEFGLTDDARLAIELDPRLIRDDDINRLADLGFERMSLGVQDFDHEVQLAINRVQSFDMIESAVGEMRRAGVNDISFDLLYGLPKQTLGAFKESLEKTLALAPDRVAVFGYAHLPSALPRQRLIDSESLPGADLRVDLAELADEMLIAAGYRRIGFDHYAKPDNPLAVADREGRLRRNFQGFTDDLAVTTLGFGASAISSVNGLHVQNEKSLTGYYDDIAAGRLPVARGIELTATEIAIAGVIQDLLCKGSANIAPVLAAVAPGEAVEICARLDMLEADGLISWGGNIVLIEAEARPLSRCVAMALDPYEFPHKSKPSVSLARAI
ncbi:oxygen-independent coproporphyrinogen III oxidase [Hyphococcus luteus]|uniref:Coproporphyrinogen-III oxidase n=1 Tax=Hyphococcus luteus TaxID=2058213 RepID=A0A2S7K8Q2_9PROT|nr:oxygen-independent coproporphyrinogen III oxidase [Marinicaulis flavus]PQA88887.1 oxygen-independent coproporphyrinogen III oxidase [Marinicaulis flavus]